MSDILAMLSIVIVISVPLWGLGVWGQRENNTIRSTDYSMASKSQWIRLLGLRPQADRVYLRYAFTQILALFYLVAGSFAAISGNRSGFWDVTGWFFLLWFGGLFIIFGVLDISQYIKRK